METITIKRNDQSPSISLTLNDRNGPIPLDGCGVKIFTRNRRTGTIKINGSAVAITDPAAGAVRYNFTTADVDTAGWYDLEWEITLPSGKKTTVPNKGYDRLVIDEDLG